MEKGYSLQYIKKANNYRITIPKALIEGLRYKQSDKFNFYVHSNGKDLIMQKNENAI